MLGSGIPDKGRILTQISAFWFDTLRDVVPNHLVSVDVEAFPAATRPYRDVLAGRSMLVRKAATVPIECVARGYLSGSGWKDYQRTGAVCGVTLPAGLVESSALPCPIFTPATKADTGHDENISEAAAAALVGGDLVAQPEAAHARTVSARCRARRAAAASSWRTRSSSSATRPAVSSC